jgi:hypothetical protein
MRNINCIIEKNDIIKKKYFLLITKSNLIGFIITPYNKAQSFFYVINI